MAEKLGPQTLVTKAAPVTPTLAVPRFEGLERLGQALTTFGERLPQFAVQRSQKQAEKASEEGRQAAALAISQGIDTFQELEDAGILSKGSNPFFRDSVLEMAGKARADQFGASIQVAYAERFGDNPSFDEDDFDDFAETFATSFEEDHPGLDDPAVTDGFAGRAADYLNSLRQKHAGNVADNILELGDETLGTLFRGKILDRLVNGDPLTQVADTIVALDEVRNDWIDAQGGIDRMSRFDKTKMNNKLVDTITSAVVTGDLTDAQATEIMSTMRSGTGSTLIGVGRHAEALTKAASTRAAFVLQQDSLVETARVRAQQTLEDEGRVKLWALFDPKSGDLDLTEILEDHAANSDAYGPNYLSDQLALRNTILAAANAPYKSNQVLKDSILTNIVQRRFTSPEAMRDFIGRSVSRVGGLNPTDALALQKELNSIVELDDVGGNRLRLFNAVMNRVSAGVGGFSPDPIIQANVDAASVPASELFNKFLELNPDVQLSDVIFQEFITKTVEGMRNQFLDPAQRDIIDGLLRQVEVSNTVAHFSTQTFITDVPTLTRWLAETQLELAGEGTGSFISEDLNIFFQQPDRSIPEEAQGEADILQAGIIAQLKRNGVSVESVQKKADRIKKSLLAQSRISTEKAPGLRPSSGLGVQGLLDTIARNERQERIRAQAERNRAARLTAPPEQNPNIPITSIAETRRAKQQVIDSIRAENN